MKIVLLITHIVCAILFGIIAISATSMIRASLYMIASISWGVCVGIDIAKIIDYKYSRNLK